jgi:putative methyltransferase (TIGR04325 family)
MSFKRATLERVGSLPFLQSFASIAYERYYARRSGIQRLFRGVYPDFRSAVASAPVSSPVGHDHAVYASDEMARGALPGIVSPPSRPAPLDYPVLFWLSRILGSAKQIFDWGGNIGTSYYAYRSYLDLSELDWIVNDVPSVIALGEHLKASHHASNLNFTTSLAPIESCDIILAAGSLHLIEDPFLPLRRAVRLPPHFLINKMPVYNQPSAVTLLNTGSIFVAYRLFERESFIRTLDEIGYNLVDEWKVPELSCHIPFHPSLSVSAYSGFYFSIR